MLSDRLLLLRAIRANPDDDTPRLIYADWLQENGEDARAEFIRLQIHEPRNRRVSELFHANWRAWMPEPMVGCAFFKRGFIEDVRCKCGEYLVWAEDLFRLGCVKTVNLTDRAASTGHGDYVFTRVSNWPQKFNTWQECRWHLPPMLYDMLEESGASVTRYKSVHAGNSALRRAALAYGRNLLRAAEERGDA